MARAASKAATLLRVVARQRLGQHFLVEAGWRARIAETLRASADDVWLEIGAGHGEMTTLLARSGARVIAIELDPHLVARLRTLGREFPNVEVVAGDVLALDFARLFAPVARSDNFDGGGAAYKLPTTRRVKVYGNLPYYITSPILHRLFENADRIESIHVVVQFEVAARLVARPGRRQYGYLSVLTQFYARPEIVLRIPPGAFRPRPKVTSALASMRLPGARAGLDIGDESKFLGFVKACFGQKRKTLLNNLRPLGDHERVAAALRQAGLRADARAEQLSVAQFADLYSRLLAS